MTDARELTESFSNTHMKTTNTTYGVNRTPVPLDTGYAAGRPAVGPPHGPRLEATRKLWRTTALAALGACVVLAGGLAYAASRRQVEMYVVRVDPAEARTIGVELAGGRYTPDENAKAFFVADLVKQGAQAACSIPVVQAKRWKEVYAFLAGPAEQRMNEYAGGDTGFDRPTAASSPARSRSAPCCSRARTPTRSAGPRSSYSNGSLRDTADYTGLFSVTLDPPTDKRAILTNPIGLYVTDINWGRDFSAAAAPANAK